MRVVLASNNAGKLAELRALLVGLPLALVAQGELGIAEADEPHPSFVENALAKARHAARAGAGAAIADDSGLCVAALGGAPGVVSARYAPLQQAHGDREAQRRAQDAANNARLLRALDGVADRRARFVCVLVALRHADDPEPLIAQGQCEGVVLDAPRGAGGFGYDPLLYLPAHGATVAELDAPTKNACSHRARAVQALRERLHLDWALG
jgi:XTP/dITP diphosphohydrolase